MMRLARMLHITLAYFIVQFKNRISFLSILLILISGVVFGQFVPFSFWKGAAQLGAFTITGVTGTTDSTSDAWLVNDTNPTVVFTASTNATAYDVVIKDATGTSTICSSLDATASPVAVVGCSLSNATSYRVYITAKKTGATRVATNEPFSFTVDNITPTVNTITGITGASDATVDTWLVGGLVPTVNWNAFTNAASYDVTVKNSTGTVTICVTQNTTATSKAFTGCNLVNGTDYKAYVTAKSPSGFNTINASNTGLTFSVDTTVPGAFFISGITGGTDVVIDAYLANGLDPSVNYGASANAYNYDVVIKDSTGTTTICSSLNQAGSPTAVTCTLTNGLSYKAYVTAKSISTLNTTNATNTGFNFTVGAPPPMPPGSFLITGATGGSDVTKDNWLTDGTTVTANWSYSPGATSYDVTIRNSTDTADVCATQNTTSLNYTFTGCTLTLGTSYLIKVTAKNSLTLPAINNGYGFQVITSQPGAFSISGATGGTDATADIYLMNGTTVTANWSASTNATSYDVTIRDATDTADVCATQNTTATTYTFTGCTLTAGTSYLIKVLAKSGAQTTAASNSPYNFLVPGVFVFCPTGSTTAKAGFFQSNLYPANPGYSNSQSCNFTMSPANSPSTVTLHFNIFGSADSGDQLVIYDGTSTGGTNLGSFKGTTTPPADQTAASKSFFLTWVSNGSGQSTGYQGYFISSYASASGFTISGVSGGTDVTVNNQLTDNSSGVTVTWGASSGATSYQVTIKDSTNTYTVCGPQTTASTNYNFSTCTLIYGASYSISVYAIGASGSAVAASNSPYTFSYDTRPSAFSITGITGGTDSTVDDSLSNGLTPVINWGASSGQTSYDVTVYESDGYTVKCPTQNVGSGVTSYNFSTCTLIGNTGYRAEVIAKNANGNTLASNSLFSFYVGLVWKATPLTGAPEGRIDAAFVWTGSEIVVWGGANNVGTALNTGYKYNPTTDSWSATSATGAPAAMRVANAAWTGSEVVVWGANRGKYNPVSNTWATMSAPDGLDIGTSSSSVAWNGTELIYWGGTGGTTSTRLASGGKYNPSTNAWTHVPALDNPAASGAHTAVWTGSEMLLFGGTGPYINAFKYNPTTSSWTPLSRTNVPVARYSHSAVWTGTEMLIWGGGIAGTGTTNTGGKYTLSTDTWTSMTTTNAPAARRTHTTVWTGTEMIIWGGLSSGVKVNTGGKYNPSTDTWTTTSTTNAPAARDSHSAVWTGTEMIVWGGIDTSGFTVNTGGKYNPSSDTWSATTITGAPAARNYHTAVWTGTEMIVWGGISSATRFNTGGKYNPSADTWSATSTTSAPVARDSHITVWTGTEMIVWGGETGAGASTNTGGKYNPSSNTWTATSIGSNVPLGRSNCSGVWTGTEIIVWGGYGYNPSFAYLQNGGRYNPSTDAWTPVSSNINALDLVSLFSFNNKVYILGMLSGNPIGHIFNFSNSSWSSVSLTNAAPYFVNLVLAGSKIMQWGGYITGQYSNAGYLYDLNSDSWTQVSNVNTPTARIDHCMIWTGTEVIVWGGAISGGYTNTGGRYNPTTDSWQATSTSTNVPAIRKSHYCQWMSSKMIVWGGYTTTTTTLFNTGGVYSPP